MPNERSCQLCQCGVFLCMCVFLCMHVIFIVYFIYTWNTSYSLTWKEFRPVKKYSSVTPDGKLYV